MPWGSSEWTWDSRAGWGWARAAWKRRRVAQEDSAGRVGSRPQSSGTQPQPEPQPEYSSEAPLDDDDDDDYGDDG